jgi:hypothetical protein
MLSRTLGARGCTNRVATSHYEERKRPASTERERPAGHCEERKARRGNLYRTQKRPMRKRPRPKLWTVHCALWTAFVIASSANAPPVIARSAKRDVAIPTGQGNANALSCHDPGEAEKSPPRE